MLKKLLILPGIVLGIASFAFLVKGKEAPKRVQLAEQSKAVRTIRALQVNLIPRARGYGYVQPEKTWEAVAEVGGKIVEIHPNLKKGVFLKKGDLLFQIETDQSQLQVEEIEADILNVQAQIKELDQNFKDTQQRLAIEQSSLKINRQELERKKTLFDEGVISKSTLDQEQQRVLVQENVVENYKGTLNRMPLEQRALSATLKARQSRLEDALLKVGKTTIFVPFDGRLSETHIELGQVAKVGQVLAVADSVSVAEIEAQIPRYLLKNLIPHNTPNPSRIDLFRNINEGDQQQILGFKTVVRFDQEGKQVEWPARFTRIAEADPKTGALGVVVSVDDPYLKTRPGKRPPLQKNMYCEVELFGKPRPKTLVIPRSALHGESVYLVNSKNRLEKKEVVIDYVQGDLIALKSGIAPNQTLIVSDVVPAIEGMLLAPKPDTQLEQRIKKKATYSPGKR